MNDDSEDIDETSIKERTYCYMLSRHVEVEVKNEIKSISLPIELWKKFNSKNEFEKADFGT